MHDIIHNIEVTQVLAPQTLQAEACDSGVIDMQGCETLAIAVLIGAIGDPLDADKRIDLKIEHADDGGTGAPDAFAACTADDVLNADTVESGVFFSADDDAKENTRCVIGYCGGKRFVKVTATPVSLATGGPVAMLALKGLAAKKPVDNG